MDLSTYITEIYYDYLPKYPKFILNLKNSQDNYGKLRKYYDSKFRLRNGKMAGLQSVLRITT